MYGSITIGTEKALADDKSFWILGGKNNEDYPYMKTTSLYYNAYYPSQMIPGFSWGENDQSGRIGHCAVNINFSYIENHYQVVIIGGSPNGSWQDNAPKSVITYCKSSDQVNTTVCDSKQVGMSGWSNFPSLVDQGRKGPRCTSFKYKDMGVAIMVAGESSKPSYEMFLLNNVVDMELTVNGRIK